ncbi:transmembrane alpha-helix domain-containing protein [Paraphaeosphaeria sporulosa]
MYFAGLANPFTPRADFPIKPLYHCLFVYVFLAAFCHAETYTDAACNAAVPTMNSCASRWDSIRTECTNSVTTNTVWPGPCECAYYRNDLPCFDEQVLCAAQVWTQVPQWFRDGVTSCLMKDASYTIRAQLGNAQNPFLVSGIAGILATTSGTFASSAGSSAQTSLGASAATAQETSLSSGAVSTTLESRVTTQEQTSTTTQRSPTPSSSLTGSATQRNGLSTGAKAGIGMGVSLGVIAAVFLCLFWFMRRRRAPVHSKFSTESGSEASELHGQCAEIHEASSTMVWPTNELVGSFPGKPDNGLESEMDGNGLHGCYWRRYELEGRMH